MSITGSFLHSKPKTRKKYQITQASTDNGKNYFSELRRPSLQQSSYEEYWKKMINLKISTDFHFPVRIKGELTVLSVLTKALYFVPQVIQVSEERIKFMDAGGGGVMELVWYRVPGCVLRCLAKPTSPSCSSS